MRPFMLAALVASSLAALPALAQQGPWITRPAPWLSGTAEQPVPSSSPAQPPSDRLSSASTGSPMIGRWVQDDRTLIVDIAPCSSRPQALCGLVAWEQADPGEEPITGQMVVRDLVPAGPGRWRGRYVGDGSDFEATVTLRGATAEYRVCPVAFLCETRRFTRTAG